MSVNVSRTHINHFVDIFILSSKGWYIGSSSLPDDS